MAPDECDLQAPAIRCKVLTLFGPWSEQPNCKRTFLRPLGNLFIDWALDDSRDYCWCCRCVCVCQRISVLVRGAECSGMLFKISCKILEQREKCKWREYDKIWIIVNSVEWAWMFCFGVCMQSCIIKKIVNSSSIFFPLSVQLFLMLYQVWCPKNLANCPHLSSFTPVPQLCPSWLVWAQDQLASPSARYLSLPFPGTQQGPAMIS